VTPGVTPGTSRRIASVPMDAARILVSQVCEVTVIAVGSVAGVGVAFPKSEVSGRDLRRAVERCSRVVASHALPARLPSAGRR
jgi:hypothetical protein